VVKVKICGITNLADALAAVNAGCDALGFVFFKKSPRYITPQKAKKLINLLPGRIIKIGVFVNAQEKTVKRIVRQCRLDILQFHGKETPEYCRRFKNYKIIKAFQIKGKIDEKILAQYQPFAYLFDAYVKSKPGGTGKKFNWNLVTGLDLKHPVFLSGGLNEKNVRQAIRKVKPEWVDASSSLESRPGKKDHKKVKDFIIAAKKSKLFPS